MEKVIARVSRSGAWWAIDFVVDGREYSTQAKRLGQVATMVRDAASLMTARPEDSFEVEIEIADDLRQIVDRYRELSERAAKAEAEAGVASRAAVAKLRAQGLSQREVAELMGLSYQRVSQLASA